MLPDDPVVKGRLFRAARALLHWNQAQLAARSGLSVGTLNALENARHSASTASAQVVARALEWAGIQFLGVTDGLGHGLRYTGALPHRPERTSVPVVQHRQLAAHGLAKSPRRRASGGDRGSSHGQWGTEVGLLAAERLLERQRLMVDRIGARGHDCGPAVALLVEMERTLRLLHQSRMMLGTPAGVCRDAPSRPQRLAA